VSGASQADAELNNGEALAQYLKHFPKPLLDDLVAGRWLPVIGAGMSRNAVVPSGRQVPLWDGLGHELAEELQDYPYVSALDTISAYAHEYGRPRMVERVTEALLINEARPGDAHRAFCSIFFDIVCTTNVDFLLERQYEGTPRYCRPIVDEDHLTVNDRSNTTALLKLHGDLHHPARLVLTEEDYDAFLDRYPLLATYLANLLITRTAVLVGYSLDDPDFRQIWQVIGERLGKGRRLAYAIMVDARAPDIARFSRRHVKVISLPGSRTRHAQVLAATFDELHEYVQTHLIGASHVTEEEPLTEFSLPQKAVTRLCFFAVPLALQPQYRDQVFPLVERAGLVPVTAADVIAPGENYGAKIDAITRRSVAALVDVTTQNTILELGVLMGVTQRPKLLVVVEGDAVLPSDVAGQLVLRREKGPVADQPQFLASLEKWFRIVAAEIQPILAGEPLRLLATLEYRAAVTSAVTLLESVLRSALEKEERLRGRAYSLGTLAELAARSELLTPQEHQRVREWMSVRNMVVHSQDNVTRAKASEIVHGVMAIVLRLQGQT
jgi:hypothetical protein